MKKRIIALMGVTACMLAASGCGKQNVEERVKEAMQKSQEIESMEYVMNMDMNMKVSADGVSMELPVKMKSNVSMIQKPMTGKIDMNIDMGDMGAQNMQMYIEDTDGSIKMYTQAAGQWLQQEMELGDIAQYDAAQSINLYMENMSSFEEKGTEKVGNTEATRIEGVIKGESLEKVMDSTGIMDTMTQMTQVEQDMMKNMYSNMGDLKMSIWIDKDNYPVKYEMDMTEMMAKMMESIPTDELEGAAIEVNKVLVGLEMTDFNHLDKIEIPEEARQS